MSDDSEATLSPEMLAIAPAVVRLRQRRAIKVFLGFAAAWLFGLVCTRIFESGWVEPYLVAGAIAFVVGALIDPVFFFRQAQTRLQQGVSDSAWK